MAISEAGRMMAEILFSNALAARGGQPPPISDSDLPDFVRCYNFLVDAEGELMKIAARLRGPHDPPPPFLPKLRVPG